MNMKNSVDSINIVVYLFVMVSSILPDNLSNFFNIAKDLIVKQYKTTKQKRTI